MRVHHLVVSLAVGVVGFLGATSAAHADGSYHWYGQNNTTCRQVGFPNASTMSCPEVAAGYLQARGSNNSSSDNFLHMVNGGTNPGAHGAGQNLALEQGGDYCTYANTNSIFNRAVPEDHSPFTGLPVAQPRDSYQQGDANNNVCIAAGQYWGFDVRGQAGAVDQSINQFCSGQYAPCNIHHWVSFASEGLRNRPWDAAFGPHGALNITGVSVPGSNGLDVQGGAFGFLCPVVEDVTTHKTIEYCLQEWKKGGGFPNAGLDTAAACADGVTPSGGSIPFDQVITAFRADTTLATQRPGSLSTYTAPVSPAPTSGFHALITRGDLRRAIKAVNDRCGRDLSDDPANWALIGIEHGAEGGGVKVLAGYTANLRAYTTVDSVQTLTDDNDARTLASNESLLAANGGYIATMQPDGNLVVYNGSAAVWQSGTYGQTGAYLIVQPDGNLVLYREGVPVWYTGTSSSLDEKKMLILQDDGNLVLYSRNTPLWSSQTGRLRSAQARAAFVRAR